MNWRSFSGATKTAVITAALGFFVQLSSIQTSRINGQMSCSHTDVSALFFGVIAILAGVVGVLNARSLPQETRVLNLALCAAAVAVGVLNVLRGFGMVGGPCAGL